jgi:hypothetical protein
MTLGFNHDSYPVLKRPPVTKIMFFSSKTTEQENFRFVRLAILTKPPLISFKGSMTLRDPSKTSTMSEEASETSPPNMYT